MMKIINMKILKKKVKYKDNVYFLMSLKHILSEFIILLKFSSNKKVYKYNNAIVFVAFMYLYYYLKS